MASKPSEMKIINESMFTTYNSSRITLYLLLTCMAASSGAFMYGYDIALAGGLSVMNGFLGEFFPQVLESKRDARQDTYCRYNNHVFQLFSSSLYLAAMPATLLASKVAMKLGTKRSLLVAGLLFDAGSILGGAAHNLAMLLSSRLLLGCGIGFANHALPLYLSEVAPASFRGRLGSLFGLNVGIGLLSGKLVNYAASKVERWGWRLSLGVPVVPAAILTMAGLFAVESPMTLIEQGNVLRAKSVLCKLRGTDQVEQELEELLLQSSRRPRAAHHADDHDSQQAAAGSFVSLLMERRHRLELAIACAFPVFQQMAGCEAVSFYGPLLFKTAGFQDAAALYSTVIIGSAGLLAAFLGIYLIDKAGRKVLLLLGGPIMLVAQLVMAIIFRLDLQGPNHEATLSHNASALEITMLCLFLMAFSFSWGPLPWIVPNEIFSPNIRSVGQSVVVFVNMLFKFLFAQAFLSMLCVLKYGIFLFFAGWIMVMSLFVLAFVPETKGVPTIANTHDSLLQNHWFWKRMLKIGSRGDKV